MSKLMVAGEPAEWSLESASPGNGEDREIWQVGLEGQREDTHREKPGGRSSQPKPRLYHSLAV